MVINTANRTQYVLATANLGKLAEIQALLSDASITLLPQSEFQVPDVEETGLTFVENALIKARYAAKYTQLPIIADDSGLEVDALQGAPGIYSARYAQQAGWTDNNKKLLDALKDVPEDQRNARFQCVIVLLRHEKDPVPVICQGTWTGRILLAPQGQLGFGYDPIFYVPSQQCSAAELAPQVKNKMSHRGQALAQLLRYFHGLSDVSQNKANSEFK